MNINTINPYDSHVINYGKEGFDKGLEVKQYKDSSGNKVKDYLDINGKLIWRASVLQDNSEVISYFDRNAKGSIINRYDETRNAKGELVEYYEVTRSGQSDSALTNKVTRKFNNKEIITNSKNYIGKGKGVLTGYTKSSDEYNHDGNIISSGVEKYNAEKKLISKTNVKQRFNQHGRMWFHNSETKGADDKLLSKTRVTQKFNPDGTFIKGEKITTTAIDSGYFQEQEYLHDDYTNTMNTETKSFEGNSVARETGQVAELMSTFSDKEVVSANNTGVSNTNSVPRSLVGVANFASKAPALLIY